MSWIWIGNVCVLTIKNFGLHLNLEVLWNTGMQFWARIPLSHWYIRLKLTLLFYFNAPAWKLQWFSWFTRSLYVTGAVTSGRKARQMDKGGNSSKHLILICCHKPAEALNDLHIAYPYWDVQRVQLPLCESNYNKMWVYSGIDWMWGRSNQLLHEGCYSSISTHLTQLYHWRIVIKSKNSLPAKKSIFPICLMKVFPDTYEKS